MDAVIWPFIGILAFAALMLAPGELLASARRTGKGKGKAGKGAPKGGSPPAGAAGQRAGRRPPSPHAAQCPAGLSERSPDDGGPPPGDRSCRAGGPVPGRDAAGSAGRGTGKIGGRHVHGDGSGPAGVPEEPPWPFPSDGLLLDGIVSMAKGMSQIEYGGFWDAAHTWDFLRGLYHASRGPDDPRVWCSMSRAALAVLRDTRYPEAAAALAAGAAERISRAVADPSVHGDASRDGLRLPAEKEFALAIVEASRALISGKPGRDPAAPFPAPAYLLSVALNSRPDVPEPAPPGTRALRSALAEAERDGAGTPEALRIRSRLGEAVADEEAWARASVTSLASRRFPDSGGCRTSGAAEASGSSGSSGLSGTSAASGASFVSAGSGTPGSPAGPAPEESALRLLRSASEGLDALLGRTHPDSLDARERLARCLSGLSGPGIPPDPFVPELPAREEMAEAMELFMETATARARAASLADSAGPATAGDGDGAGLTEDMKSAAGLLRRTKDERALAAAASAAECGSFLGFTPEQGPFFNAARTAALDLLDPGHPIALKYIDQSIPLLWQTRKFNKLISYLVKASQIRMRLHGAYSGETAESFIRQGIYQAAVMDHMSAANSFCDALEVLEETHRRRGRARGSDASPAGKGLPPGRAGRDILLASSLLARSLCRLSDPRSATAVLARFRDTLPDLPSDHERPSGWPFPAELAGRALCVEGEAAFLLKDHSRAETLLRRAADCMGPNTHTPIFLSEALALLSDLLAERGDVASSREAALIAERVADLMSDMEGQDCPLALDALLRAASRHEEAGDADAAIGLHRKVLAARKRLLGPMDEATRQSRAEIRRLEEKKR